MVIRLRARSMTQDSDCPINFSASLQMLEFPKNSLPRSKTNQPESGRNYRVLNGLTLDKVFDKSKTVCGSNTRQRSGHRHSILDRKSYALHAMLSQSSNIRFLCAPAGYTMPRTFISIGLSNGTNKMAYRILRDFAARKALREIDPKRRRLAGSPYLGRQN
jgi:hypothetical protein